MILAVGQISRAACSASVRVQGSPAMVKGG